jgi:hypothetical protein
MGLSAAQPYRGWWGGAAAPPYIPLVTTVANDLLITFGNFFEVYASAYYLAGIPLAEF